MSTSAKAASAVLASPGVAGQPTALLAASRVWTPVVVAALAMVATLPGRTHGLGLVTEPLLKELQLDRISYATLNLWATLLGALFCLPCGYLIDRLGTRLVLAAVSAALGTVVIGMSWVQADWWAFTVQLPRGLGAMAVHIALGLFLLILLTRGFGQSALSVVSLALIGRSARRHAGPAFGVYSFVVVVGFMVAFKAVGFVEKTWEPDWRALWASIGGAVIAFAAVGALVLRPSTESGTSGQTVGSDDDGRGFTLSQALVSPTFWVFGVAASLYGAIAAGIALFSQSILEERGFNREVYLNIAAVTPLVGLASNLATGWLASRVAMGRLLCAAMLGLAGALAAFPFVNNLAQVYAYAVAMGLVGGMITVLFFAVWSQAFGPAHLGKIQGAAQMLTVLASALGPRVLAMSKEQCGSYVPVFQEVAAICAMLAIASWFTPVRRSSAAES